MGQAHGDKQHLTQLLGAVGVEAGAAGLHVDAGEHLFQLAAQLHAELVDAVTVYQHADAGHVRQHLCQRELDLVVKGVLTAGGDLGLHFGEQVRQTACVRVVCAGEGGSRLVAGHQLTHLILGSRGVQQVGGQFAVPHDAAAPAAGGHGLGVKRCGIEHIQRHIRVIQQAHELCVFQRVDGGALHGVPALGLQHHVVDALLAHHGGAGRHQIMPGRGQRQRCDLCLGQVRGLLLQIGGRDAAQPEALDQGVDLQLLQHAHGFGLVALADGVGPLGGVDGRIGADGAQGVAQLGQLAAFQQMFPLLRLDALVVDVLIHPFQRTEVLHEGEGGLFADAPHAWDIVGSIAHQALDLDELLGLDAVFFADGVHIHGHGLAAAQRCGGQQHRGGVAHQLQAVAVSRGKEAVVLPGRAGGGQRAQDVVGFPAFGGDDAIAQVREDLLQHRHLLGQLVRHTVAGGLVALVHLVAEGGGLQVKGHGHFVGLGLLQQGEHDIQKAENGVGITAVLGGQQLDAEKGTVGDAVAVNDQ